MFKAPFSFQGRIGQAELMASGAICLVVFFVCLSMMSIGGIAYMIGYIVLLFDLWFYLAQSWKRAQDCGWMGAVALVPVVNPFLLMASQADPDTNRFGPNPEKPTVDGLDVAKAWREARANVQKARAPQPAPREIRMVNFKCGTCGAPNSHAAGEKDLLCQFCGAPKA